MHEEAQGKVLSQNKHQKSNKGLGMRLGQRPRNEANKFLGYWTNLFDIRLSRDKCLNGFLKVSLEIHCLPTVLVGGDIT